ncbi:MAG TPA: hypothetical protein VG798_01335 [Rhizomicrobium sp.]|nr:hypothetical protein [Rhizomicrobium sp.]
MDDKTEVHKHIKKFHRWLSRHSQATLVLSKMVETVLVSKVLAAGYEIKSFAFDDREDRVLARELHLERANGAVVDFIEFSFEKWGRPRFLVHFGRRQATAPFKYLRTGNLVFRSTQYYCLWGKPWWMPNALWSNKRAENSVRAIDNRLDQIFAFLDTGKRGPNISPAILKS